MFDIGRQADLEDLGQQLKHAVGSERDAIERAIYAICNESGLVRSMRERLIREMRNGNTQNVKDIRDYIQRKSKYHNE